MIMLSDNHQRVASYFKHERIVYVAVSWFDYLVGAIMSPFNYDIKKDIYPL